MKQLGIKIFEMRRRKGLSKRRSYQRWQGEACIHCLLGIVLTQCAQRHPCMPVGKHGRNTRSILRLSRYIKGLGPSARYKARPFPYLP